MYKKLVRAAKAYDINKSLFNSNNIILESN